MSASNVVPMPTMMSATWPPPSAFPAGCCPPGGMDALLQCYCDIQAATAFISKVVTDLAANDPAFQKALVDAIAASGSNIPLIGVTNGSQAQPGQVGEYVQINLGMSYTAAAQTQTITMGVLQPGDWDVWCYLSDFAPQVNDAQFSIIGPPAGFTGSMGGANSGQSVFDTLSRPLQANISVPTLIAFSVTTNASAAGGAGSCQITFTARRRR